MTPGINSTKLAKSYTIRVDNVSVSSDGNVVDQPELIDLAQSCSNVYPQFE